MWEKACQLSWRKSVDVSDLFELHCQRATRITEDQTPRRSERLGHEIVLQLGAQVAMPLGHVEAHQPSPAVARQRFQDVGRECAEQHAGFDDRARPGGPHDHIERLAIEQGGRVGFVTRHIRSEPREPTGEFDPEWRVFELTEERARVAVEDPADELERPLSPSRALVFASSFEAPSGADGCRRPAPISPAPPEQ